MRPKLSYSTLGPRPKICLLVKTSQEAGGPVGWRACSPEPSLHKAILNMKLYRCTVVLKSVATVPIHHLLPRTQLLCLPGESSRCQPHRRSLLGLRLSPLLSSWFTLSPPCQPAGDITHIGCQPRREASLLQNRIPSRHTHRDGWHLPLDGTCEISLYWIWCNAALLICFHPYGFKLLGLSACSLLLFLPNICPHPYS